MNIDAYNLDSLRALVRKLEKENQNLKQKLNEANIPYSSENIFDNSSTVCIYMVMVDWKSTSGLRGR